MQTIEADPKIAAAVGNVSLPACGLSIRPNISHIPGNDSLYEGFGMLVGWMLRGQDAARDAAARRPPVARSRIGIERAVVVSDPELCAQALRNTDGAWSTALGWLVFIEGMLERNVLLTSDFDEHRRLRRLLQPAFSRAAIEGYSATATDYFESATDDWVAAGEVRFKPVARRLFARVSAKVFVGTDDPHEAAVLDEAMAAFWMATMSMTKNRYLSLSWRKGVARTEQLASRLTAQVKERRAGDGTDLFSRLCQSTEANAWLDDAGVVYLFMNIMEAAFDTTAAAVTSMAYALARRPEWQERLREEALAASDGPIAYDDLGKLEQLEWFWKETLRFYPVAFAAPRVALRDVTLGGIRVPAGTFVDFLTGMAMRDSRYWSKPDTFDPERFSPARAEDRANRQAFLPFGAGAHGCIGQQLSAVETKAFWHSLLRKARFRLTKPYEARHTLTPLGVVSGKVALTVEPL